MARWSLVGTLLMCAVLTGCAMSCTIGEFETSARWGDGERIEGSGTMVTTPFELRDFVAVDASGATEVHLRQGDQFAVAVTCDDNIVQYLDVKREGDRLAIGLEDGHSFRNVHLDAEVTMPRLERLDLSGACNGEFERFEGDTISVDLSGASKARGELAVKRVQLDLSGASRATLSGNAAIVNADISGASHADLGELAAEEGTVEASGASKAEVNIGRRLDVDVSGASDVGYRGSPALHVERSGSSKVHKAKGLQAERSA